MAGKTTSHRPRPCALTAALLLALLLALSGCGGGGDAAQEAPADAAGAAESPSAPAENPLAGDSPLESGGSSPEGGEAPSNAGATSNAGGSGSEPSASGSSASDSPDAGGSASAEDVPDVSGGWSGTATDGSGEEARLQFDIEQNGSTLTAAAYFRGDGDDEATSIEPLRGTVDDAGAVELVHESARGQGSWSFAGALDGNSISGESTLTSEGGSGGQQTSEASFAVSRTSAQ